MDQDHDDAISAALSSRRIPHGRSKGKVRGKGSGKGNSGGGRDTTTSGFSPLRTLGRYEITLGSGKSATKIKGKGKGKTRMKDKHDFDAQKNDRIERFRPSSWMEIHQLTPNEDGLLGTFNLSLDANGGTGGQGIVTGMFVLAGSRKGLAKIVQQLDQVPNGLGKNNDNDHDNDHDQNMTNSHESNDSNLEDTGGANVDCERESADDSTTDHGDPEESVNEHDHESHCECWSGDDPGSCEASTPQHRFAAFEKNTFRNPKFWIKWRGQVKSAPHFVNTPSQVNTGDDSDSKEDSDGADLGSLRASSQDEQVAPVLSETNSGYMIYASNTCDKFDGVISCQALSWDKLKIKGWKVGSKASPCTANWSDF